LKRVNQSYGRGEGALSTFFFAQMSDILSIILIDYLQLNQ